MNAKQLICLLSVTAPVPAAAQAGQAKLTECQSTVVFAGVMTQGGDWCGTYPGTGKVLKDASDCALGMTEADVNAMITRGKADMYKNFLKYGAKGSCDILAAGMQKVAPK